MGISRDEFITSIAKDGPYADYSIKEIRKDVTSCRDLSLSYIGNITIYARKLIDYDVREEEERKRKK